MDKRPYVISIHGTRHYLEPGDWVIAETDGEHFYPCKDEVFRETYDPIGDEREIQEAAWGSSPIPEVLTMALSAHGYRVVDFKTFRISTSNEVLRVLVSDGPSDDGVHQERCFSISVADGPEARKPTPEEVSMALDHFGVDDTKCRFLRTFAAVQVLILVEDLPQTESEEHGS